MRAALRPLAVDGRASFARAETAPWRGCSLSLPCAACEELKTFAAGRDLTDWGLCGFKESWAPGA
jgi:hypothetical protein